MMRTAAAGLALLCAAPAAHAADPGAILVLDGAGIIAATVNGHVANPGAYSGYSISTANAHLVEATHEICARLGVHFGIFYHLRADVPAPCLPVIVTFNHPPWPNAHGTMQARDTLTDRASAGRRSYAEWFFEDARELKAGPWRITVMHGDMVYIDELFHVQTACAAPVS